MVQNVHQGLAADKWEVPLNNGAFGVTRIRLSGRVKCFCPLGDDWYSGDVDVVVDDPAFIPDYCDVDRMLATIDGNDYIIEEVCSEVHGWFKDVTRGTVSVSVRVSDSVHLPVVVTKEG